MKRHGFTIVSMVVLVAALCMGSLDDGMRGYFGRSGYIQGIINNYRGTGTTEPGYYYSESCDGTGVYIWPDNDGGLRSHTAVPTADTDGLPLVYVDEDAIVDVNNITADLVTLADSRYYIIDSSGAAVSATLADGTVIGQMVTIACKVAGNNIDISVEHHVTSDPEVIRLDTAKEWIDLLWDGTDWVEVEGNGQTYPI